MERKPECEATWNALCSQLEGSATEADSTLVDSHLARCPRCLADRRFLQRFAATLARSPEPVPPAVLRDSILQATVRRQGRRAPVLEFLPVLRPAILLRPAFAGAIAAGVLAFAILFWNPTQPVVPAPSPLANESPTRHEAALLTPESITEDRSRVSESRVQLAALSRPDRSRKPHQPRQTEMQTPTAVSAPQPSLPIAPTMKQVQPEAPDLERPAAGAQSGDSNPRIDRATIDPPSTPASAREPIRIARAEDRPAPPPSPEFREMHAGGGEEPAATYTLEAKSTLDPGAVASLADLKRTLQKDAEEESLPAATFRMNDRRELRLSVHTSRF